jgi:nucleotide-binding universal stress UspA family protein
MRAARYALDLVRLTGAEILLVHCHRRYPSYLGEPHLQKAITKIRDDSNKLMEPYRELFEKAGVAFTERLLEGPARQAIPDVAEIENVDLIVMGSRGRTDFQGMVLGSVAHKVLNATSCPVLVVR